MKTRTLTLLFAGFFTLSCLAVPALAQEDDPFLYLSLGDSIAAGYGLSDAGFDFSNWTSYDMRPNFQGYSSQCYTALLAEEFGWSREQALNLGLTGAGSKDLLDIVQGNPSHHLMEYDYPEIREYICQADLITIEIGLNNAFGPYQINVFEQMTPKLDDFASVIRRGTLSYLTPETVGLTLDSLQGVRLTLEETRELAALLTSEMLPAIREGLETNRKNLPLIIETVQELNPDADIILLGYANPLPLVLPMRLFFREMNRFAEELAQDKGILFVPIPDTEYNLGAHPTAEGHEYISQQLIPVIRSLGY